MLAPQIAKAFGVRHGGEEPTFPTLTPVRASERSARVERVALHGYGANVPSRPKSSSMRTTSRSSGVDTSMRRQVSMAS